MPGRRNLLDAHTDWHYALLMEFTWSDAKRLGNIAKHGVDFTVVRDMEWDAALVRADLAYGAGEVRLKAILPLGDRLYLVVFTLRTNTCRIISLRKASNQEVRFYAAHV